MTGRSVAGWCQTCGEVVRWGVRRQFVCDGQRWRVWECGGCGGKRTLIRPATEADQEAAEAEAERTWPEPVAEPATPERNDIHTERLDIV